MLHQKEKVASAAFSFCTFHSSLFAFHSSLRSPPQLFPVRREEIKEKRIGSFAPQSIDFSECYMYNHSIWQVYRGESMESPLLDKSLELASQAVLFYEEFSKSKKDTTIAKQLLRSATSIGANINEAVYGNSKADFIIAKLHISLKETGESIYWLTLLKRTGIFDYTYDSLLSQAEEIKRMLIASIKTAKENNRG